MVRLMALSGVVSPMAGFRVAGTAEPMPVPNLLLCKAGDPAVMSRLAGSALSKARTLSGLAVPNLTGSGAAKSSAVAPGAVYGLAVPAVANSVAVPSLASRAGNSVPVFSLDVFAVADLTAKRGLLVAIVAKCLPVPLIVSRVVKSMAIAGATVGMALWRCSRGLRVPLDLGLPLPEETLAGTWAAAGPGCL